MPLELNAEERTTLLAGLLGAAMAVMAADLGVVSTAQEALALGRELEAARARYAANPLIRSLFDSELLRGDPLPETLTPSPDDVRTGRILDRALEDLDQAMTLARSRVDEATAQEFAGLIMEICEAVAHASGPGLFGSGEKLSEAEKVTLGRIRTRLAPPRGTPPSLSP